MADVIMLKSGEKEIVFDLRDFLNIIDEGLGEEAADWLENYLNSLMDVEDEINDLEEECEQIRDHHNEVMEEIYEKSSKLTDLIASKELDQKAISDTVDAIFNLACREVS